MMIGGIRRPLDPSNPCTSLPQIPHESTRTRTSPGPTSGMGMSLISSRLYSVSTIDFIACLRSLRGHPPVPTDPQLSGSTPARITMRTNATVPTMASVGVHDLSVCTSVSPPIFAKIQNPESFIHDPTSEPAPIAATR